MRLQKVHARVGVALISISLLNCRGDPTSLSDVLRERILLWRGYGSSGEILFLSLRSPREISTMYVMDTAGTNAEMLGGDGACTGPVYEARWSPEGNRIAYSCAMPLDLAIHTIEANGTGVTRISQPDPQSGRNNDFFPAWSPDGRRIAFTSDGPDIETHATYDLYVMRLDGTRARVTTDSTWDLVSDWGRPR